MSNYKSKKPFQAKPAEEAPEPAPMMKLEEPTVTIDTVEVRAVWSAQIDGLMLVTYGQRLFLIDAAIWDGRRNFTAASDALKPVPDWTRLTSKVTPAMVSEMMLRGGIINEAALTDGVRVSHFLINLNAAFAEALRE